ncbi:MAG TPA: hypothetical protein VN084_00415 [Methylophilaceae bacterium]|nr:hypothetical protein [Methylophilaceae bacterium]
MSNARMTAEQAREYLATWAKHGFSCAATARATGLSRTTWSDRISTAKIRCPDSGIVPTDVPDGMKFTKTTVQYDGAGNVIQEWRRLHKDAESMEALVEALAAGLKGKCPALPRPAKPVNNKRTLVFPIYDPHFGKHAWEAETGENYDIKIAERVLVNTARIAMERSGPLDEVVFILGGDWFHSDTRTPQTERSGHVLDVDTRSERVRDVTIKAIVAAIAIFSAVANKVHVVCIPGNHDHESMHWTARILEAVYAGQKHITVDRSPRSRRYLKRGKMLLGIDHGMMKINEYLTLMPCEAADLWATTTERLWLLGHIHQQKVIQKHGVTVEHLESISATDAWHAESGYVGNPRRTVTFLIDPSYGLVSRSYITVQESMQ